MTEKRFTSSYNGDESLFTHFLENGKPMTKQEVLNRLNELPEKNKLLLRKNGAMEEEIECLSDENEQLKKDVARYRGNFREIEDVKCELAEENEQLKSENKKLNERIGILEGSLIDKGFDIND